MAKIEVHEMKVSSDEMVEMKKSDYDRLISEVEELKQHIYYLSNYCTTWEEHKKEQEELKKQFNMSH